MYKHKSIQIYSKTVKYFPLHAHWEWNIISAHSLIKLEHPFLSFTTAIFLRLCDQWESPKKKVAVSATILHVRLCDTPQSRLQSWLTALTVLRHQPTSRITTMIATHLGIVFPLLSLSRCILGISISVNWNDFDSRTLLEIAILRHILRNAEPFRWTWVVVRETDQNKW